MFVPDNGYFTMGDGSDFKLRHTGAVNEIVANSHDINVYVNVSELAAKFIRNGGVELYYDNALKLDTVTGGVSVTGKLEATTLDTTGANEFTAQQGFNEAAITSTSNAVAWNLTTAQTAVHTLTENTTISAPSNMQAGTTYELRVVQAAGLYTLAWNAAFKWGAATVPAEPAANGDVVIFSFYSDGTNMYGIEANRTEA